MARTRVTVGVFLQARLGSTRLPRKALLPLAGRTCLEHVLSALRGVKADIHALLTDAESAPAFAPYARQAGFELFTGPAEDVLARYCQAANLYRVTRVVRATGDNPLVSAELANLNLLLHRLRRADLSRLRGAPLGTGVEVVETTALYAANALSADASEHEHVTPYILRHEDRYQVHEIPCPGRYFAPNARVTLDTEEDYRFIGSIFQDLFRGKPIKTMRLMRWLKEHAPAKRG